MIVKLLMNNYLKEGIKKQQFQISTITEGKNPLARKVNLNRYNKEEETLNYLKTFLNDDEFKVADNLIVPSQRYVDYLDPDTGEVIGIRYGTRSNSSNIINP
jgi:hypothetical protein